MEIQPEFSSVPVRRFTEDHPVHGPQAWLGPNLARNPDAWTYTLTATQIAELCDAIRRVATMGIGVVDIRAKDFPFLSWGAILQRVREDMFEGRGFAVLRGFPVAELSPLQRCLGYFGIGSHFGHAGGVRAISVEAGVVALNSP